MVELKKIIKCSSLLRVALTHRSWAHEQGLAENNERLEFLGDSVLSLIVSEFLFRTFPRLAEGELALMRAQIVSMNSLARAAVRLNLGEQLYLGKGEESSGGRQRESILADAFEALLGAIYIESGLDYCRNFLMNNLSFIMEEVCQQGDLRDAKTILQEAVQQDFQELPSYEVVRETGPDHQKWFVVDVFFAGRKQGTGEGPTKKLAQQKAAALALERVLGSQ